MFGPDGAIWGVEYLTPPQATPLDIFGQQLSLVEAVGLDALHLSVIDNPGGQFTDFNADASCGAQVEVVDSGSGGLLSARGARGAGGALAWLLALGVGAAIVSARRFVGRRTDA